MKSVKDYSVNENTTIKELMDNFGNAGGFSVKKINTAKNIYKNMQNDKDCFKILSHPACIVSTGTRGLIKDMIKNKKVDAVMTTCGTLDHDLARLWKDYYQGSFNMDDKELHQQGINRLGNVLVPNECYGDVLEERLQPIIKKLYSEKKVWNVHELIWAFGESIKDEENAKDTIIYWSWKNKIPIYLPGPLDGAWGAQLWNFWQMHRDFNLNLFEDDQDFFIRVTDAKKVGAIMLGGGISKHHVIWFNQFRNGMDYAIQISTAVEYDGSLSGAQTREAISWGKISEEATHITVEGDVTLILPLIIAD
jgi:deoxyhypusine synthase